jgi:hypothetical protein
MKERGGRGGGDRVSSSSQELPILVFLPLARDDCSTESRVGRMNKGTNEASDECGNTGRTSSANTPIPGICTHPRLKAQDAKPARDPVDIIWSEKKSGKGGRTGTELEDRDEPEVEDEGPLRTPEKTALPERGEG